METKHNSVGHETEDVSIPAIVLTGAGLAIGTAMVILLVYGIFHYLAEHPLTTLPPNPMAEVDRQEFPPTPRIEEHPAIELGDLRTQEDHVLSTYGWTDKRTGIVHLPIDRAMDLELQRGFPVRKEAAKQ